MGQWEAWDRGRLTNVYVCWLCIFFLTACLVLVPDIVSVVVLVVVHVLVRVLNTPTQIAHTARAVPVKHQSCSMHDEREHDLPSTIQTTRRVARQERKR